MDSGQPVNQSNQQDTQDIVLDDPTFRPKA